MLLRQSEQQMEGVVLYSQVNPPVVDSCDNGAPLSPSLMPTGHLQNFELSCKEGCDDDNTLTRKPLHTAAENGCLETIAKLIGAGADVSCHDEDQWTALHHAARHGHIECINALMEAGADASCREKRQLTPLHIATLDGHVVLFAHFLTPVMRLVGKRTCGLRYTLPRRTVMSKPSTLWFVQVPMFAVVKKIAGQRYTLQLDMVMLTSSSRLQKQVLMCQAVMRTRSPLHVAARSGNVNAINALLKAIAHVSCQKGGQWTPLHLAARNGHADAIVALVEAQADVSCRTDAQWTPLHFAAQNGHVEAIHVLLRAGASVSSRKADLWTPLHLAVRKGNIEVVNVLLNAGADVSSRTNTHRTPLCIAAQTGRVDICKALIEGGAILKDIACCQTLHLNIETIPDASRKSTSVDVVKFMLHLSLEMPPVELMNERSKKYGGGGHGGNSKKYNAIRRERSCLVS